MQSKHQNIKLPPEMLVDIFKATDGAIMENLLPKFEEIPSMLKQKDFEKLWINQVNNLLTSSSIVYNFVGKEFQKRWVKILEKREKIEFRMAEIDERIARLDEYRRRNEEIKEKIIEKAEILKAKLEQNLRRQKANFLLFFILVSAVLIHHLYLLFK